MRSQSLPSVMSFCGYPFSSGIIVRWPTKTEGKEVVSRVWAGCDRRTSKNSFSETALFYCSRGRVHKSFWGYELKGVIGPNTYVIIIRWEGLSPACRELCAGSSFRKVQAPVLRDTLSGEGEAPLWKGVLHFCTELREFGSLNMHGP